MLLAVALMSPPSFGLASIKTSGSEIAADQVAGLKLDRRWRGSICTAHLTNTSDSPRRVDHVVVFRIQHNLPRETALYGEGFTMLSQTGGTIAHPVDIGAYTDHGHYRMPVPAGATTVYNVLSLTAPGAPAEVMAYTTENRFANHFDLFPDHIDVVIDTKGLTLKPGESWPLEEFMVQRGASRIAALGPIGDRISHNYGPLRFKRPVTGWCSWQTFGTGVTTADVARNLDEIKAHLPGLKYIQIDDGYQAQTGDWLETGKSFGGGIQNVLHTIREKGFQPAIWVAPFVATEDSKLFKQHPDWFVQDDTGHPLRSDKVTFGGWHPKPWYVLDGTNPGARGYLHHVFSVMRNEWGCTYFKLDAINWGAIKGGHFHDPSATRIQAYRQGMEAIRAGAGKGAFILGGNHPCWASFGEIDGQRSGMDIGPSWDSFSSTARENLSRAWQNGKLWWNDPDTSMLIGKPTEDEFLFHLTVIAATGGLVLSGDDTPKLSPKHRAWLLKLLPPSGRAARFDDDRFESGAIGNRIFFLNWSNEPSIRRRKLLGTAIVRDFWTGQSVSVKNGMLEVVMPPRSGRIYVVPHPGGY
jgi:alpha-galactosidase